jgi:hypothetical protein
MYLAYGMIVLEVAIQFILLVANFNVWAGTIRMFKQKKTNPYMEPWTSLSASIVLTLITISFQLWSIQWWVDRWSNIAKLLCA